MPPTCPGPTVGVLGGRWRGSVTSSGAIRCRDGGATLEWHVAGDDRWYVPATEATIRQTRLGGTPVVETRLRVPGGDVVHRVYAVADHGGITVIDVENDSPLPVAVAFSGARLMSARPAVDVPIEGIDLPADASVFPIGHRASIKVGLAHHQLPDQQHAVARVLPPTLPSAAQVARGWSATCDRASRLHLPDRSLADQVVAARCELALGGPSLPAVDPVGFLLGVDQIVRMTSAAWEWMPDVADAVARIARQVGRTIGESEAGVALDAAAAVIERAGDARAARDLDRLRATLAPRLERATGPGVSGADLDGGRFVAATERRLAARGDLLPGGIPAGWLGQGFEVEDVPTGPRSAISYAIRWHGPRPAILWECSGEAVRLTSSHLAPHWSSDQPTGEALWPAPPEPPAAPPTGEAMIDESISFG